MQVSQKKAQYRFYQSKGGFSLIEVMITIALIALIITFGLCNYLYLNKALVRSEVEKIYSICMYLQRLAMVTNKKQTLTFDMARNSYHYQGHEERLNSYTIFAALNGIKGPPSTPTNAISSPVTFVGKKITFTPTGILQPGTIYLTDKKKQYQYALTVPVSQISFLRKYQYDEKWTHIP